MSHRHLDLLYRQKSTVISGMANVRGNISDLKSKISRLDKASTKLSSQINELQNIQRMIHRLNISENEWRGKEKSKFKDHYHHYQTNTEQYIQRTKDAKEVIDEEKRKMESSLANAETHLKSLGNTLQSLNNKIAEAKEG